ncbi:MAG TPA: peptide-N4-asparagine amidase [Acidimicrobiales bacterium]|nr:peptide-N4-asparagine amidase [Acidimicrobiales bacterium]
MAVLGLALPASAAAAPAHTDVAVSPQGVAPPTATQQETEADRPVPVPATASCTVTAMTHTFGNSYGAPYVGTVRAPAACPGPWNTVVMTFTSEVGGVQFDRTVSVDVGGVQLLLGTTSEPCCTGANAVTWTVTKDITDDQALFGATPTPLVVELDNVNDATYTGQYASTLSFTFYDTGQGAPVPAQLPVFVAGVTPQAVHPAGPGVGFAGNDYTIGAADQRASQPVTFPRDLATLQADLFAEGQGPCEEFWWSEPSDCGVGTPYREVTISIDGLLAGAAPIYPTTFTGADGPGLWEPIPSPRAWDLRAYRVDLTPFVAHLSDGRPHTVSLGVTDAAYTSGDFWALAADLLGTVQHYAPVTTGGLTAVGDPALAEAATSDPTGTGLVASDTVSSARTWRGWIAGADGTPVTTTVTETSTLSSSEAGAVDDAWTWKRQTGTVADGHEVDTSSAADFSIVNAAVAHFSFTDDDATTRYVDGVADTTARTTEDMRTSDASGLAANGAETEDVGYADTAGSTYQATIAAVAGEYTTTTSGRYPATTAVPLLAAGRSEAPPAGYDSGPAPDLPEAPLVVGPLVAAALTAGIPLRRWRRVARRP